MPQTAIPRLGINYDYDAGTDGWKAGYDAFALTMDALTVGGAIVDERNTQPVAVLGDAYIIGTSPSGADWTGNARALAVAAPVGAADWIVISPVEGMKVYDLNLRRYRVFDGVEWQIRDDVIDSLAAGVTIDRNHYGATIELNTSAAARDVTIPQDSGDDLPIGFFFYIVNDSGTNSVTFTLTGLTTRGIASLAGDRDSLRIVKSAADTWITS